MNIRDIETTLERLKSQPKKTILILVIAVIIIFGFTYGRTFVSEKAKQQATLNSDESTKSSIAVDQQTTGDQSPAINTDGDVKIVFEGD